jgi:putative ABC transport system permease protein
MGIETTEHKKVTEELNELFDYNEKYASGSTWIYDLVEDKENIYALITVLQMLLYAFITLITLVTLANIINTISTSINARRKEFAMIKSVGVTPKGFKKMVALESIFYGAKALIFAIPISIGISYLLNVIVADGRIPFKLDALMYIIVVVAVMLIVGFSMLLSMHKVKNDNIIETIKEDIT